MRKPLEFSQKHYKNFPSKKIINILIFNDIINELNTHNMRCVLIVFTIFLFHHNQGFSFLDEDHFKTKVSRNIRTNFSKLTDSNSNEGLLLHVANPISSLNRIFFKAYLLKDKSRGVVPSSHIHVEVWDQNNRVILHQLHKLDLGMTDGYVELPKDYLPGYFKIIAYTSKMLQNTYDQFVARNLYVIPRQDKIEESYNDSIRIGFEGGTFVTGKVNKLFIYKPDNSKNKIKTDVFITDENDNIISNVLFHTSQVGTANINPYKDKTYFISFEDGKKFKLPRSSDKSYILQINNLDRYTAHARILNGSIDNQDSIWLSGTIGGKEYFKDPIYWLNNSSDRAIDKTLLPSGVLKLRIIDRNGKILACRPILVKNPNFEVVSESVKNTTESNSKIIKTFQLKKPVSSRIALSILKKNYSNMIDYEYNSVGNLIETSVGTFKGKPGINRKKDYVSDLLVQIQFTKKINENFSKNTLERPSTSNSRGIKFSGYVYDFNNDLLTNKSIQIIVKSNDNISILEVKSDSDGFIMIEDLDFIGISEFTFRTDGKELKERLVKFVPSDEKYEWNLSDDTYKSNDDFEIGNISKRSDKESAIDQYSLLQKGSQDTSQIKEDSTRLIELEEVVLEEQLTKNKIKGVESAYGVVIPGKRVVYQDPSKPKQLDQLLAEIPGVQIRNYGGIEPSVIIPRANGQALWVIDGYAIPKPPTDPTLGSNTETPIPNFIVSQDIERIDFLLGADASIYGVQGAGGVFVIRTRSGNENQFIDRKLSTIQVRGYEPAGNFDNYINGLSKGEQKQLNIIFWDPNFEISPSGEEIMLREDQSAKEENYKMFYSSPIF